jgi:hypothetical protein
MKFIGALLNCWVNCWLLVLACCSLLHNRFATIGTALVLLLLVPLWVLWA